MKLVVSLFLLCFALNVHGMDSKKYDPRLLALVKHGDSQQLQKILFPAKRRFDFDAFVSPEDAMTGHNVYCFAKHGDVVATLAVLSYHARCLEKHEVLLHQALEHICFSHKPFDVAQALLFVKYGANKHVVDARCMLERALYRRRLKVTR